MRHRLSVDTIAPSKNCKYCLGTKRKMDIGGIKVHCDCSDYYAQLDAERVDNGQPLFNRAVDKRSKAYKDAKHKLMTECGYTDSQAHDELVKATD